MTVAEEGVTQKPRLRSRAGAWSAWEESRQTCVPTRNETRFQEGRGGHETICFEYSLKEQAAIGEPKSSYKSLSVKPAQGSQGVTAGLPEVYRPRA